MWYLTLRQNSKNAPRRPRNVTALSDLPEAFQHDNYQVPKREVEIIKKPSMNQLLRKIEVDSLYSTGKTNTLKNKNSMMRS